jgi:hypothetical protein
MCIGRVVFGPSFLTPLAIVCPHRVIWALLMCDKNIHLPPTFYGYYDDSLFSFLSSFLFFYSFFPAIVIIVGSLSLPIRHPASQRAQCIKPLYRLIVV